VFTWKESTVSPLFTGNYPKPHSFSLLSCFLRLFFILPTKLHFSDHDGPFIDLKLVLLPLLALEIITLVDNFR
jgi:hypothetical protein